MDRHHNELFKYIYRLTGNYETTEDLLQEFFMLLYRKLHLYNSSLASFRTWMYRLVSNHVMSYLRKNKLDYHNVSTESELDIFLSNEDNQEDIIVKEEQVQEIIYVAQRILKEKALRILLLNFFSGLTVNEISDSLGLTNKAIYKSIKTSIEKIKKEVSSHE